jgi:hypothetical protein
MRPYTGANTEKFQWFNGSKKNIRNNGFKCLDVHGGSNTHNRHVIFWNCHNGANQGWWVDQNGALFAKQPLEDGRRF